MSSADGPDGPGEQESPDTSVALCPSIACQLFESMVHHLIEKGVLTKNDALSIVQTVVEVKRGVLEEEQLQVASDDQDLRVLRRLYSSFELVPDRPVTTQASDSENVLQLRPPLHADRPEFPQE